MDSPINWNNYFPKEVYSDKDRKQFISELSSCISLCKSEKINLLKSMPQFEKVQLDMMRAVFKEEADVNWNNPAFEARLRKVSQEWQDDMLKSLSSLILLHNRIHEKNAHHLQPISPVLLAGPTGCAKTAMVRQTMIITEEH